jgi:hypothetical protein
MVVGSEFVIQKITQMGQRFTELHRVNQRLAVAIHTIELVQAFAPDHEHRYPAPLSRLYLDAAQIAAIAQKVCASKNVGGFKMRHGLIHLLPGLISKGSCDRKRESALSGAASTGHQPGAAKHTG